MSDPNTIGWPTANMVLFKTGSSWYSAISGPGTSRPWHHWFQWPLLADERGRICGCGNRAVLAQCNKSSSRSVVCSSGWAMASARPTTSGTA